MGGGQGDEERKRQGEKQKTVFGGGLDGGEKDEKGREMSFLQLV